MSRTGQPRLRRSSLDWEASCGASRAARADGPCPSPVGEGTRSLPGSCIGGDARVGHTRRRSPQGGWPVRLAGAAKGEDAERSGQVSESRTFVIEDSLGYLVNRMARLMAHDLAERIRPAGVAIGQWAVLLVLWARDGMTQAELSRGVAFEPSTVFRTIDRMVRA